MNDVTVSTAVSASSDGLTVVAPPLKQPSCAVVSEGGTKTTVFQERFGRYLILERLSRGSTAEVVKAVAEGPHDFRRVLVLKRLLPQLADSIYFVNLFADQAKLAALLQHSNLVHIHEFGVVAGVHYLAMEHLDGMDLRTLLESLSKKKECIPPAIVAFIGQQVAHGLSYGHAASEPSGRKLNVVNMDVSPQHVMLTRSGAVKLLDFGIAMSNRRLASTIAQGKLLEGKLGYTSPEQATGQPLDRRADLFSLGVVMWEMLTGQRLFLGQDDARTLSNLLERPIVPPSQITADIPPKLDAVVMRALSRDPAHRQVSADALADELDEVLRLLPYHRHDLPQLLKKAMRLRPAVGSALRQPPPSAKSTRVASAPRPKISNSPPPTEPTPKPTPALHADEGLSALLFLAGVEAGWFRFLRRISKRLTWTHAVVAGVAFALGVTLWFTASPPARLRFPVGQASQPFAPNVHVTPLPTQLPPEQALFEAVPPGQPFQLLIAPPAPLALRKISGHERRKASFRLRRLTATRTGIKQLALSKSP